MLVNLNMWLYSYIVIKHNYYTQNGGNFWQKTILAGGLVLDGWVVDAFGQTK